MIRLLLAIVLAAAAGCSMREKEADDSATRIAEARDRLAQADGGRRAVPAGAVIVHDGLWIGGQSVLPPHGDPLPTRVETKDATVLNSMGAPLALHEIVAEISAQTQLPVIVDDPTDIPSAGASTGSAHARTGMTLSWSGPLSGLLDGVTAFFDVQWEFRGDAIRLFRDEVRTFALAALPATSTVRATVNTTGGGAAGAAPAVASAPGAGQGGAGPSSVSGSMLQDTANETTIKLWDDVKETIQAIVPAGSKVAISPAAGTVTVIAPPAALQRVARYIEAQNARMTRQVTIAVKVLRVDVSDTYDLGLDLGVVFQQMAGNYGFNLSGPAPLGVSGGTPASYVVQALHGPWTAGSGIANASHAVVDALQTVGKVSLVTETRVTTLNGQAAPVSVAEQQSYVASTATTLAGGVAGAVQTQITPASLITGFNMQVFPRILDDGEILLQYGLSLSDLKGLTVFGASGSQVQLPDVNLRSFLQQVLLRSGDLLVLAGYQSTAETRANSGLPDLGPSLFGGSVQNLRSKSMIVIMMTPEVMSRGAVPRSNS